ncbi:MAG: hypothetical protein KF703_19590 [Actinobacteria bacterium]|nr:hypothetical protein [Actinomycetota bacterium]
MSHTFEVTVEAMEEGPEEALRDRWATCAARRLSRLEEADGAYPEAGGWFDILDTFEGPFLWELSDAELEANPPSSVEFEVVSVDPPEPPGEGVVRVTVRVPF